ncbi:MAG TPA: alcohol dehydrogenase catalytic domain-containing protein [Chloroflexia bacterium]|nr:alcohol dehydrogenase catalytic domain-containing protein [Chloroflexia bacterium]
MQALVWRGPNDMVVDEIAQPAPGPGEVLIAVRAVGICGSDIHGYTGASGRRAPGMVMGHEFAGEVVAQGPGIDMPAVGTRVAVNPLIYCGECVDCHAGREQLCRKRRSIGVNMGQHGGFAEFVTAPARNAIPLADSATFAEGTMAEPLAVGLRAATVAEPAAGQPLVILGGGTIGLCTLLASRDRGVDPVYVTDVSAHKTEMIERLGGRPLDPRTVDLTALGQEVTDGRGFAVIIDAVAVTGTIRQALPALAPGGMLMLVGLATPAVEVGLYDLVPQERVIKSAYAYSATEYRQAVEWLNTRRVNVGPLLEAHCSLADAPAMFARMARGEVEAVKVIVEV